MTDLRLYYGVPDEDDLLEVAWVELFIRAHPDLSLPQDLPVVRRQGQWLRCGISSGHVDLPVAVINGAGPVATATTSFGAVKSLFR